MSTLTAPKGKAKVRAAAKLRVIDCDIHPAMGSWQEARPFLTQRWWDHLQTYGNLLRHGFSNGLSHPRMSPDAARTDAHPPEGGPPGSSLELLRSQHLDPNGVEMGVLIALRSNPGSQRNPEFAAALASAMNDWQVEHWVAREPRLRASILVAQEDADAAVAEIEKRAGDDRFVQILILPRTDEPLGRVRYRPILAAAERAGLPICIHVGGAGGHPSTGGGWPSYYMEEHQSVSQTMQSMVVSLVLEGAFERFPALKVIIMEGGIGWIPSLTWRLDKHWARLRSEVPHVPHPPSTYIRRNIWFTTQPIEEPASSAQMLWLLDTIGRDRLLFSTDYPHWDFDDPRYFIKAPLSEAERHQILFANAARFYGVAAA